MKIEQPLLFVSYRLGESKYGGVMSEYSEDKLRVIEKLGIKTYVVTSLDSVPIPRVNIKYYRVPSLSLVELKAQVDDLRACHKKLPLQFYLVLPFAITFGLVTDIILKFFFRTSLGLGGGYWSWPITAFPVVVYLRIKYGIKNLLATGSASAGIIGAFMHLLTGVVFYYEIPDPIVGVTMNYTEKRLTRIKKLETFIIKNSDKTIFNTEFAAKLSRERCPLYAKKISSVYPGAWDFAYQGTKKLEEKITFLHVGSLYQSRNFDLFLSALKELEDSKFISAQEIRVINIGTVNIPNLNYSNSNFEFIFMSEQKREIALEIASKASVLMLVQHIDYRSKETIPFKLYDYLNLSLPILGLIDNSEIENILMNHKEFLACVGEITSIKSAIMECIKNVRQGFTSNYTQFNVSSQFLEMLSSNR
jgi:glycosyltransferase involved in cell wall biosynthesis